ncbi:unnamed protein product [Ostreobium quekettii]|uniref:Uncharacterized protein n=1 Tax=Ostreobium quekettii TaxID=121088 RepID=A0A8S1JI12_9CHLO|nr:unnamed protein product [Ostreobium quekettii]|eukprot:evm.model.scf_885.2 EVM.evm.TU.scf_885.2   scf_885:10424-13089(-)
MHRSVKKIPQKGAGRVNLAILACLIQLGWPRPALGSAEERFDAVKAKYGAVVRRVAEAVVERHGRIEGLLSEDACACSYDPCGRDFDLPDGDCMYTRTPESVACETGPLCGHMKLAPDHTSVRTPPSAVSQAELDPIVVKDICLTQGLEGTFKDAANFTGEFTPWLYFAVVETGVMRWVQS